MKSIISLALAGMLGLTSLVGADFNVDTSHSNIGFKVKHMMISNVTGNFQEFEGSFSLDEKSKVLSSIEGTVTVSSITTQNKKRDDHLRSADFFDAEKYPQMTLKLIKHEGDKAIVELTIKDVTKQIEMEVEDVSGIIKDPWGNSRAALALEGKIDRKAFNINFNKMLETGGLLVDDKVKLNIELEGIMTQG